MFSRLRQELRRAQPFRRAERSCVSLPQILSGRGCRCTTVRAAPAIALATAGHPRTLEIWGEITQEVSADRVRRSFGRPGSAPVPPPKLRRGAQGRRRKWETPPERPKSRETLLHLSFHTRAHGERLHVLRANPVGTHFFTFSARSTSTPQNHGSPASSPRTLCR